MEVSDEDGEDEPWPPPRERWTDFGGSEGVTVDEFFSGEDGRSRSSPMAVRVLEKTRERNEERKRGGREFRNGGRADL